MYLHDNKDVFAEIIQQARTEYGYEREITEVIEPYNCFLSYWVV